MLKTCVVVADRARARLFVTEKQPEHRPQTSFRLAELEALANPEGELTGAELFSDIRSGSNRTPAGARFAYDDHRERHRHELERRFARHIAASLVEFVQRTQASRVVLAADPHMLGLLRRQLSNRLPGVTMTELAEDLSWHSLEHIQSALNRHGVWQH